MTKAQLFILGSAILTAVLNDLITWLQARQKAKAEGKEQLPGYDLERLAEKVMAGILVGLGGAGVSAL